MTSEAWKLQIAASSMGERNDCVVRALALGANIPYREAHSILKSKGRKDRRGTPISFLIEALRERGFKLVEIIREHPDVRFNTFQWRAISDSVTYHSKLSKCKTIRTLERVLPQKGVLLIWTSSGNNFHSLVARGGKIHDWSSGRCLRIKKIWQITS